MLHGIELANAILVDTIYILMLSRKLKKGDELQFLNRGMKKCDRLCS